MANKGLLLCYMAPDPAPTVWPGLAYNWPGIWQLAIATCVLQDSSSTHNKHLKQLT